VGRKLTLTANGVEEFGRILVRQVRDAAIDSGDRRLDPGRRNRLAMRWAAALTTGTPEEVARTVIMDSVDDAIFYLLLMIDQQVLRLSYTTGEGDVVDLSEEGLGELSGWYMGAWRYRYSEQRFVDDFSEFGPAD
jgi:hypothetical protein